jgi:hypothetical protein
MLAPSLSKNNPQASEHNAAPGGPTPGAALGSGDARNIEGVGIQHTSKRRLSASWQQCGVVEGASVTWNSDQD